MSGRVWAVAALLIVGFVLAVVGVVAIVNFVTGSRGAPVVAQPPPTVEAPTVTVPDDTPTPAPVYVPCGDGTFAPSEADCESARQEAADQAAAQPTNPPPPTEAPAPTEAPPPPPPATNTPVPTTTAGSCRPDVIDYFAANPTLTLQPGQFAVADFYPTDGSWPGAKQAFLTPGTWTPLPGMGLGKVWTWTGCPEANVRAQAGSAVLDPSAGFSGG
jgi:hypothetical protein